MEDANKRARVHSKGEEAGVSAAGPEESRGGESARAQVAPQAGAPLTSAPEPGSLPPELRAKIEQRLAAIGEVKHVRKSHKKGPGPVRSRCLPAEDLVHEKAETVRKGGDIQRIYYRCSNPKCGQDIRYDKWDAHVRAATSDGALQEAADDVLERSMNYVFQRSKPRQEPVSRG